MVTQRWERGGHAVNLGIMILTSGILMFITPLAMAWAKFGRITEEAVVRLMMELNAQQIMMLRFFTQSGVAFVFMGAALLLMGF